MVDLISEASEDSLPDDFRPDTSERIRSRIEQYQNRVDRRYSQLTWQVQRTWGRILKTLYKEIVVLLCRVLRFPFVLLCKLHGFDFWTVIRR